MALAINGTTGISGVDGSASAPALTGTDSNTGINFASDTVNINTGGTTRATIDSAGALDVPTTFPIKVNGSEKLKIDSSGNLVVGTASASAGGNSYRTVISDTIGSNEQLLGLQYEGVVTYGINAEQNGDLSIKRDGVQRCVLTNVGRFLINTTTVIDSSSAQLVVKGIFPVTPIEIQQDTSNNHFALTCRNSNGLVGAIRTNGSSTHFDTSSDYRIKENAVAISDGITRLKTLKPYRFNFKADPTTTVDGFFAHEVTAVPEAINGTKDEVDSDNNPVYQGIDQSKLVPLLTAALQEAVSKIETLETKVAALEAA